MNEFLTTLQAGLAEQQIELNAQQLAQLAAHWRLVQQANASFNLTAIKDDAEAAQKHYLDCLLLAPRLQQAPAGSRLADIGSGAGFPGLVLAVACPQLEFLLLESVAKKSRFLAQCAQELGLVNVRVLTMRAEEAARLPELREQLDYVTARAVAALPILLEYALPLLRPGGCFIGLKGPGLAAEEEAAKNALALLGGQISGQSAHRLPDGSERYLAAYEKTGPTPEKYPRRAGMPEKRPL